MANDKVKIRPATRQDIKEMFGDKMRDSCRAWSGFYNGKLVCIGGVAITSHLMLVFMQGRDMEDIPNITIWRGALEIFDKIKSLEYPVLYAIADPKTMTAPNFLSRLGFEHVESSVRGEIYRWPTR